MGQTTFPSYDLLKFLLIVKQCQLHHQTHTRPGQQTQTRGSTQAPRLPRQCHRVSGTRPLDPASLTPELGQQKSLGIKMTQVEVLLHIKHHIWPFAFECPDLVATPQSISNTQRQGRASKHGRCLARKGVAGLRSITCSTDSNIQQKLVPHLKVRVHLLV